MINYTTRNNDAVLNKMDKSKRNILIIGSCKSNVKNKMFINPVTPTMAKEIYGDCDLVTAYEIAYSITNDSNIYTVNCPIYTDSIEIIDRLAQYDFDFIVPLTFYLRDSFINPITNKETNFCSYYLKRLGYIKSTSTLIVTDYSSDLYESIDHYLSDMNDVYDKVCTNSEVLNKYGSNLVFILNNLKENPYSHVYLAACLSICNFDKYPNNINIDTYYDIDYPDVPNKSMCFYKYHKPINQSSIEQLNNMKQTDDVYKKVLIDLLIKFVVKSIDLSEYNGSFYNPYVKLQIEMKVKSILKKLSGYAFADFTINNISFVKTDVGVGHMIVDITIDPHNIWDKINIIMEV